MLCRLNYVLPSVLLTLSSTVFADDSATGNTSSYYQSQEAQSMANLSAYLQNLGQYFGYDVTRYCSTGGPCSKNSESGSGYSNTLLAPDNTYSAQLNLFNSYLGSLLGGGGSINPIVPSNTQGYSLANTLAGQTYSSPPYSSPSTQTVSVASIIDQQTWQSDPVSQAVLNIITTPDASFCTTTSSTGTTSYNSNCQILFREKVMAEVVGPLKPVKDAFSFSSNQALIPQLNMDTLLSPLMYTTTSSNANSTSSSPDSGQGQGLPAQTQAQQAANFIRYVTSAVNPLLLPSYNSYNNMLAQALNYSQQTSPSDQAKAQITLINYMTKLRVYAAQSSVGISNLYYMLSRRLPQNPVSGNGGPSSEALNEFTMASWRLYNPNANGGTSPNQQWLTQINQGSNASVQKEIAILLAEINYQLYLTRQQQERILMTESILLLQNVQTTPPDGDLNAANASSAAANDSTGGAN